MKVKEYIIYTLLLLTVTGILMKALQPTSNYILNAVFHWLPSEYNYVQDMSLFSKNFIIIAIVVSFFFITLILPITEEIYFRGFLLARMKWMGKYSVLYWSISYYSQCIISGLLGLLPQELWRFYLYFMGYTKKIL